MQGWEVDPSPAFAEGWACCPESKGRGSDGKFLRKKTDYSVNTIVKTSMDK